MFKRALLLIPLLYCHPALAQDGYVFDPDSHRSYEADVRDSEDRNRSYDSPSNEVDIYGHDGQIIDRGQIDADGNVFSNQTGSRIGVWRN